MKIMAAIALGAASVSAQRMVDRQPALDYRK